MATFAARLNGRFAPSICRNEAQARLARDRCRRAQTRMLTRVPCPGGSGGGGGGELVELLESL
jgi:hypothetical protein